jgi:hypothetical protein
MNSFLFTYLFDDAKLYTTLIDASVKLYENIKLELVFYVINELSKEQDIDVRIQDTQGFAQSPTIISERLTPGQNYTGKFVITGGSFGVTTYVSFQLYNNILRISHKLNKKFYQTSAPGKLFIFFFGQIKNK